MKADTIINVRRQPNGHDLGSVKFSDIWGIHWSNISGGYNKKCSQEFLFGYIHPDKIIDGEVACSGRHNYDNGIKVVILKKYNKSVWSELIKIPKNRPQNTVRLEGQPACTKKIVEIVMEKQPIRRMTLRQELLSLGYQEGTIRNALKRLENNKKISVKGNHYTNQIIELSHE